MSHLQAGVQIVELGIIAVAALLSIIRGIR